MWGVRTGLRTGLTLLALVLSAVGSLAALAQPVDSVRVYLPLVVKPGAGATVSCPSIGTPAMAGTSLSVTTASYLGGSGTDAATAVDIGADCAVVLAGRFEGIDLGQAPLNLLSGGAGALVRLRSNGNGALSVTRIGDDIQDMEIRRGSEGEIAVVGRWGVALLSGDAGRMLWSHAGSATRVAIGNDGTVAVLRGKTVTVYDLSGSTRTTLALGETSVHDIAVDAASESVIATGFNQKDGATCGQLQVAWIKSYSYGGGLKWQNYNWTREQVGDRALCADTRGYRVAMGRDGFLYFAGEGAGGNAIYHRNPRDIDQAAANVKPDKYHDPYNTNGAAHLLYYARLNPADGAFVKGQWAMVRLLNGKANTVRVQDGSITADEQGNVYISGVTACCLPEPMQINDTRVGASYAGGGFVLALSADLTQRRVWMVWDGGAPPIRSVTAGNGIVAMAGAASGGTMFTYQPIQPIPNSTISSTTTDGFFSVWPGY